MPSVTTSSRLGAAALVPSRRQLHELVVAHFSVVETGTHKMASKGYVEIRWTIYSVIFQGQGGGGPGSTSRDRDREGVSHRRLGIQSPVSCMLFPGRDLIV